MNAIQILNVGRDLKFENLISKFVYQTHQPLASTRYTFNDEIRFPIQQNDVYTLPSRSFLQIRGKLTKGNASNARFVRNGIAFLFDHISYNLNNVEVDKTRNLGSATLLKGLVSYTKDEYDYSTNSGFSSLTTDDILDANGEFSVCIPLRDWLGFFEDYDKIIISMKQELILQRAGDDRNALFSATAADTSKVTIESSSWLMPYITVSDAVRIALLTHVEKNKLIQVPF